MTVPDPVPTDDAGSSRERFADAVRTLGHTSLRRDLDAGELSALADEVEAMTARLDEFPFRERDLVRMKRQLFPDVVPGRGPIVHFDDCFVSGPHNPLGIGMQVRVVDGGVLAEVTLRPGHEGAPERAHGGIVAAVFDDVMGYLMTMHRIPGFTGELTVRYLAPTPIGPTMRFESHITSRAGRKIWTEATATAGDDVVATASAVFVTVSPERFRAE